MKRHLYPAAMMMIFGLTSLAVWHSYGLHLNDTPSMPIGIYMESKWGDLVIVCPPAPWDHLSAERGYRSPSWLHRCADGNKPLLKPVVAEAGETITVSKLGTTRHGTLIPNSAPLLVDALGRPLQAARFGKLTVPAGAVWVISSYEPRSFDSRYFGLVPVANIRARVVPLLTF